MRGSASKRNHREYYKSRVYTAALRSADRGGSGTKSPAMGCRERADVRAIALAIRSSCQPPSPASVLLVSPAPPPPPPPAPLSAVSLGRTRVASLIVEESPLLTEHMCTLQKVPVKSLRGGFKGLRALTRTRHTLRPRYRALLPL